MILVSVSRNSREQAAIECIKRVRQQIEESKNKIPVVMKITYEGVVEKGFADNRWLKSHIDNGILSNRLSLWNKIVSGEY